MNEALDHMPCGFLTLTSDGMIESCNQTLGTLLAYDKEALIGQHMNVILSESAKVFMQLYFFPLILVEDKVEEMYLSFQGKSGEEIPALLHATRKQEHGIITCVIMPMKKRDAYENQLLIAKKVAEEALKEKEKVHANLEIALATLQEKQAMLLEVNEENERFKVDIQNELQLAKNIQEKSLTASIVNEFIAVDSYYHASRELSGDNFGLYQINEDQYGVILLDVMGNGISSALVSMSLHSLFQRLITRGFQADVVIRELDRYLHTLFQNNEESWHYCTVIYLIIDTDKKTVTYTNAGHPPAILQKKSGIQQECHATSPPIGAFEGIRFTTKSYHYEQESRILLYTDGVSEMIGERQLRTVLRETRDDPLDKVKGSLLNLLQVYKGELQRDDDQCFIIIDLT